MSFLLVHQPAPVSTPVTCLSRTVSSSPLPAGAFTAVPALHCWYEKLPAALRSDELSPVWTWQRHIQSIRRLDTPASNTHSSASRELVAVLSSLVSDKLIARCCVADLLTGRVSGEYCYFPEKARQFPGRRKLKMAAASMVNGHVIWKVSCLIVDLSP